MPALYCGELTLRDTTSLAPGFSTADVDNIVPHFTVFQLMKKSRYPILEKVADRFYTSFWEMSKILLKCPKICEKICENPVSG